MNISPGIAGLSLFLAGTIPAHAATIIDFVVSANNDQFTVATTSNVVSRSFYGTGEIEFSGNPQSGLFTLSDITSFSLGVTWNATLDDGTVLFDNFSYALSDLDWLYSNFDAQYQPRTLDLATKPVDFTTGSPSGIVQKPLSVQVAFNDSDGVPFEASTAFWVYPPPGLDNKTLSAVGPVSGSVSGLPSSASSASAVPAAARFSSRAFGVPSPVPEPSTWAMMIAGIGAVGAVSRRRPRVVVSERAGAAA